MGGYRNPGKKRRNPTWTTAAILAGAAYIYGRSETVRKGIHAAAKGAYEGAKSAIAKREAAKENPRKRKGKRKNPLLASYFWRGQQEKDLPPKEKTVKSKTWKVSDYLGWDNAWLTFDKPVTELTARTKADKNRRGGVYGGKDASRFTLIATDSPDWLKEAHRRVQYDAGLLAFQLEAKAHGKTLKQYIAALKAGFRPEYMSYTSNEYD